MQMQTCITCTPQGQARQQHQQLGRPKPHGLMAAVEMNSYWSQSSDLAARARNEGSFGGLIGCEVSLFRDSLLGDQCTALRRIRVLVQHSSKHKRHRSASGVLGPVWLRKHNRQLKSEGWVPATFVFVSSAS